MKVTKLVVGILMIVLSVFIFFQSSLVGLGNTISDNGQTSGSSGTLVALMWLSSGIVYLATKSRQGLGGDIACMIMLGLAWLSSAFNTGDFSDLVIWSWSSLIIGVGFFIWHLRYNKSLEKESFNG